MHGGAQYPAPVRTEVNKTSPEGDGSHDIFRPSDMHVKQERDYKGSFVSNTGVIYVASRRKVVLHYICSFWFPLDVFSILPSAMDFIDSESLFASFGTSQDSVNTRVTTSFNPFLIMRLLRVARLIKLVRLIKYRRIYNRMVSRISISNSTAVKLKVTAAVLIVSHCTRRARQPRRAHTRTRLSGRPPALLLHPPRSCVYTSP